MRGLAGLLALIILLATVATASAGPGPGPQTINVGSSSDFYNAIQTIDNNPNNSYVLNVTSNVTMSQQVLAIQSNSTVTVAGTASRSTAPSIPAVLHRKRERLAAESDGQQRHGPGGHRGHWR